MGNTVSQLIASNAGRADYFLDEAEAVAWNSKITDLPSFDLRPDRDLEECAFTHPEARERERALWELAYRGGADVSTLLRRALVTEPDPAVRWNLMWLALKVSPESAHGLIQAALHDDDCEVRDWARLYLSEITGTRFQSDYRAGVVAAGRPFDQTLPLQIAGFAVVSVLGEDRRIILSPLWFAHIQGRVMACTRRATFMTALTIEKAYFGLHPDGTDHYEIYPFRGKSWNSSDGRTQHRYVTKSLRPIYLSGRVEEDPDNKILVPMIAARAATTVGRTIQVHELTEEDGPPALQHVVSDVRGQYFGWAYASTRHYVTHGDVLPGTVQLVSPVEPETAHLVNCYICGTFRGKIADHNRDGLLDVNELICHGSEDGLLDYGGDGGFAADPFE